MLHRPSLLLFSLFVLAACGGEWTAAGRARNVLLHPERTKFDAPAPDSFFVTMKTSAGDIELLVHRAWSPLGADRLHWMARHNFFSGARFFRVVPGFVVQFGLTGIPEVDKGWNDRLLADEPVVQSNRRGTITFATGGPNTRSAQLFINLQDNAWLDGRGFSPIGEVISGMHVVDRLYSGYGEMAPFGKGPDQDRIMREGNAYLRADFPALDSIARTTVRVPPAAR